MDRFEQADALDSALRDFDEQEYSEEYNAWLDDYEKYDNDLLDE